IDNDSEPVITIALTGPRSVRELTEIADNRVRDYLERAAGVGEIQIRGDLERVMNIWIDADRLDAYGIPITAVRDALIAQNADIPGGNLTSTDREFSLRTMGRFLNEQGFQDMVVTSIEG